MGVISRGGGGSEGDISPRTRDCQQLKNSPSPDRGRGKFFFENEEIFSFETRNSDFALVTQDAPIKLIIGLFLCLLFHGYVIKEPCERNITLLLHFSYRRVRRGWHSAFNPSSFINGWCWIGPNRFWINVANERVSIPSLLVCDSAAMGTQPKSRAQ